MTVILCSDRMPGSGRRVSGGGCCPGWGCDPSVCPAGTSTVWSGRLGPRVAPFVVPGKGVDCAGRGAPGVGSPSVSGGAGALPCFWGRVAHDDCASVGIQPGSVSAFLCSRKLARFSHFGMARYAYRRRGLVAGSFKCFVSFQAEKSFPVCCAGRARKSGAGGVLDSARGGRRSDLRP